MVIGSGTGMMCSKPDAGRGESGPTRKTSASGGGDPTPVKELLHLGSPLAEVRCCSPTSNVDTRWMLAKETALLAVVLFELDDQ